MNERRVTRARGMPPKKTVAELQAALEELATRLEVTNEKYEVEKAKSERLEAQLAGLAGIAATVQTVASGHMASDKRFADLEKNAERVDEQLA